MFTSLYTGVSGINAHMSMMSVTGNNIANMDTYGFKSSRSLFADIINQSLSGVTGDNIGLGVSLSAVAPVFSQGAFETTENSLDLAVDGTGFFIIRDSAGSQFYTRAGLFDVDQDGYIVDKGGRYLQGYQADSSGNILDTVDRLMIDATSYPPVATANLDVKANLASDESIITTAFDPTDTDNTANFATTVTVYDSLGNGHSIILAFRKATETVAGNTWNWYAITKAADSTSGVQETQAYGSLSFNTNGALTQEVTTASAFNFTGGPTQGQTITFDFGTSLAEAGGDGLDGTTQFGAASGIYALTQDGFPSGSLQAVQTSDGGLLTGTFTNGKRRDLGMVALANFPSIEGLDNKGNMIFAESAASGAVVIGRAGSEGLGTLRSNTLELSNVDIAGEFVRMITAQRGFQANSKVITTSDEVLMELVNLKR